MTLLKNAGTTWSAATDRLAVGGSAGAAVGHGRHGHRRVQRLRRRADARPVRGSWSPTGKIHYFIGGGQGGGPGGGGGSSAISSWVQAHYSSTTVGGTTVYDLTKAKPS